MGGSAPQTPAPAESLCSMGTRCAQSHSQANTLDDHHRQTINTSTQLPTSQTMQQSRHSRNSLRCEHKVAQSRCKHNQHRRGRGQEKHRHQHRHQPHRISASNDCSLCNEHRVAQSHRRQPAKHLASISKTMSTKSLKATVGNQHINHKQLERNINERVRRGHGSDYLEARQYSVGQRCCEGMHLQLPRGRHRPLCSRTAFKSSGGQ